MRKASAGGAHFDIDPDDDEEESAEDEESPEEEEEEIYGDTIMIKVPMANFKEIAASIERRHSFDFGSIVHPPTKQGNGVSE